MKKTISFLLAITLALGANARAAEAGDAADASAAVAVDADMSPFQRVDTYTDGQFTDVAPEDWYSAGVAAAYELGLMRGESGDYFDAAALITVEQAVVLAVRLHSIYYALPIELASGETWCAPYVCYAEESGILSGSPELSAIATRAQFADILFRALPEEALEQINDVGADTIPDVKAGDPYAESIYALYRAGVVTGSGPLGEFRPENSISRAEAAVLITRMADKTLRQRFTLQPPTPGLIAREAMDDSFFARSAILGNSLVNGLQMYSNMKSLHYFSATSVSVVSATKTKNTQLNDGSMGTLLQALCQEQYDRIYIELGINEIYYNVDYFIGLYSGMLDSIRAAEPEAELYILSVLPVTKHKSESDPVRNMARVNLYNDALYKLAEEKQCHYMDLCSALQGDDGYLPSSWSSDGVHLRAKYYSLWENCMRTMY